MRPASAAWSPSGRAAAPHRVAGVLRGSWSTPTGSCVAHATGTFKYLKGLPAGGKRIQRVERIRLTKDRIAMATSINKQIHLASRPDGEAERRQLPLVDAPSRADARRTARCWCATTT